MSFAAVFRALVGSYVRHESGRTALTVLGVALGVAVLVSIDLTNESALRSFRQTVEDVAGRATLTVSGAGAGVDPALTAGLRDRPEVLDAQPLIEGAVVFPGNDSVPRIGLTALGVDLLAGADPEAIEEAAVRDVRFTLADGMDFLALLAEPDHFIVGQKFADEAGLALGDRVGLLAGARSVEIVVAGVVDEGEFASAFGGRFLLGDLGAVDLLLQRGGTLDRIDLVTAQDVDVDEFASKLGDELGPGVLVERPGRRSARVDEMLAAFRFNLRALGHVSLLVGAFLIYNTMSIAVVRRRTTIGTLRAMGVRRRTVRAAFLAEGALIGAIGGVVGIVGGLLLAWGLLGTVTQAISMNFVAIRESTLFPSPGLLVGAFLSGIVVSVAAAWGPAREASGTAPANTMRRGSGDSAGIGPLARLGIAVVLAAGGFIVLTREPGSGIPWVGYTATALFLGAFVMAIQPFMKSLASACRRPGAALFGAEGLLAATNAQASLSRSGVAISGLMISVGMTVSVTVMVASFRDTVISWMDDVLIADIYVSAEPVDPTTPFSPIPPEFLGDVQAIDGVAEIDPFKGRRVVIDGKYTTVAGAPFRLERFRSTLLPGERSAEDVVADAESGQAVIVSESFARKHDRFAGDSVELPVPDGAVEMLIAGVYRDYSSEQGYVIMSRELYVSLYDDRMLDSLTIWLDDDVDPEPVRRAILNAAEARSDMPMLAVRADAELRRLALEQFDRTFGVTEILKVIAVIVAILGVTTTLLAQILDRRDEFGMLRTIGVSRRSIARIIIYESGLIGLGGIVLGVAVGMVLSYILTKVIMLESFGWSITFVAPPLLILQIAAIVLGATLAAGFLPAREAVRVTTVRPQTITG